MKLQKQLAITNNNNNNENVLNAIPSIPFSFQNIPVREHQTIFLPRNYTNRTSF